MPNESVWGVLEKWELTGEMVPAMAQVIDQQLDDLMERELSEVESSVDTKPHLAFARLTRLISFLNAALMRRPSIIRRLEKWVQKVKAVANALGKKLGANGFSIGVGLPIGVSIDLSFPII